MRFEHILRIYWSKGYFYGGKLFYFNQSLNDLFYLTPGLGFKMKKLLIDRFEMTYNRQNNPQILLSDLQLSSHKPMHKPLNSIFSQVNSVNNQLPDLHRLNIIKLYLIKSYKGFCHAMGKPVKSQRTWSNAWNSFKTNKILRTFISETNKQLQKNKREEKINYKLTKKKYMTKKKKKTDEAKVKPQKWF